VRRASADGARGEEMECGALKPPNAHPLTCGALSLSSLSLEDMASALPFSLPLKHEPYCFQKKKTQHVQ